MNSNSSSSDLSLVVAARSLAAATVAYLEPQSRGLTFAAYDDILKTALRPPFSDVLIEDSPHGHGNNSPRESPPSTSESDDVVPIADLKAVPDIHDLRKRFSGDYDIKEIYDRSGKQRVRCLCAVIRGKIISRDHTMQGDGDEYQSGSISITFRGTDTLENVLSDVQFLTVPYDAEPLDPGADVAENDESSKKIDGMSGQDGHAPKREVSEVPAKLSSCRSTVHVGFRDAWCGDDLRSKVMQYICERVNELHQENAEAISTGLNVSRSTPTIDITGHSLGGSIAVIAANDLAKTLSSTPHKNAHIRVYVHGCPRVGNGTFTQQFNELVPNCWNIINDNDIIPAIPHTPSMSRFHQLCSCLPGSKIIRNMGYQRHGRVVILKSSGRLIIDPTRRQKYRREAKVLRVPMAIKSHETGAYRSRMRAAIESKRNVWNGKSTVSSLGMSREETMQRLLELLDHLERVIVESRADPYRSIRILPGAT